MSHLTSNTVPPGGTRQQPRARSHALSLESVFIRLADHGVTLCTVGDGVEPWPRGLAPRTLSEDLAANRPELLTWLSDDEDAVELPQDLRRWPSRERYRVAMLERQGMARERAVERVRGVTGAGAGRPAEPWAAGSSTSLPAAGARRTPSYVMW